ncbi:hypothetical protein, partial [Vandammella animalimorsus]|uniref:hypothetical protein n=1 Tax=Vandammella animalimorsus TaxID=2029117 RepID=UPI001EEE2BCA
GRSLLSLQPPWTRPKTLAAQAFEAHFDPEHQTHSCPERLGITFLFPSISHYFPDLSHSVPGVYLSSLQDAESQAAPKNEPLRPLAWGCSGFFSVLRQPC